MNKKLITIALGGVAVWYFFLRKKTAPATMLPKAAVVPTSLPKPQPVPVIVEQEKVIISPAASKTYVYPAGLVEGDYVKGGSDATVYVLYNGQKRPMTAAWAARYAVGTWDRTKFVDQVVLMDIPTGSVLDA